MKCITSVLFSAAILASVSAFAPAAFSKAEDWQDTQGMKFHGEPTELLGPFAVFRTSRNTGLRVALHLLTPADCVRVYEGLKNQPARAEKWANATGEATHELINRVLRVDKDQLVPVNFATRPEPAVLVVFYVNNEEPESWDLLRDASAPFIKLQHDFPGQVEGVMYGIRHKKTEHTSMAMSLKVPWLVTDFYEQGSLNSLNQFVPDSCILMVLTRDGVPLFSVEKPTTATVTHLFGELSSFLDLVRPENPKGWSPRGYYWSAVQPVVHAHDHADPVLVGNPLMAQGLIQRKVFRFDAEIHVSADGSITGVKTLPNDLLPDKMAAPISDGLKKAVFVPAVQDGKFVDGVYLYHFRAAP